ncbi:MAG: hypothetical protein WC254_05380, partial [Candidatus Woesearchaeota archaeon]
MTIICKYNENVQPILSEDLDLCSMCKICGTEVYTVNIYTPSKSTRSSTEYWGGPVGQIRISPRSVIKKIL